MKVVLYKENPEILEQVSQPVTKFDKKLVGLVNDMFMTTKTKKGVGLAAIQLGVALRVLVIDNYIDGVRTAMINPEIISQSEEMTTAQEGCLSFPGEYVDIERPVSVQVRYTNLGKQPCVADLQGFTARIFFHEYDHLQGTCIVLNEQST